MPYTITVDRKLASAVGMLSFTVNCPVAIPPATSAYVEEVGGSKLSDSPVNAEKAPFNVAWAKVPDSPTDKSQGQIQATCVYPKGPPVTGPVYDVVFNPGNTVQVRSTGTLNDVITWPTWSTYFPTGGWLTTPPTAAITSGSYPTGAAVTGPFPVQYQYTYTISNTLLCFQGAPVRVCWCVCSWVCLAQNLWLGRLIRATPPVLSPQHQISHMLTCPLCCHLHACVLFPCMLRSSTLQPW